MCDEDDADDDNYDDSDDSDDDEEERKLDAEIIAEIKARNEIKSRKGQLKDDRNYMYDDTQPDSSDDRTSNRNPTTDQFHLYIIGTLHPSTGEFYR